jgi:hypothetical protein
MRYTCPVCGYPGFDEPPWTSCGCPSYDICPSCGIEFGYGDFGQDEIQRGNRWRDLRQKWIEAGMLWSSSVASRPPDWDPVKQLKSAGICVST